MEIKLNEGVKVRLAGRYVKSIAPSSKDSLHLAVCESSDHGRRVRVQCDNDISFGFLVAYANRAEARYLYKCPKCFSQD